MPAFRLYGSWEGASGSWLLAFHNHPHSYFTAVLPVTLALLTDVRLPSCSSPNVEELHNCSTLGTAVHYARLIFFFFFPVNCAEHCILDVQARIYERQRVL